MVLIMQQKSRPSNRRGTGGQSGSEGRSMSCYHYEHTQSRERGYQPGQPLHRTVWFGVRTQAPTPNWHRICKCHTPGLDPWAGRTQDSHLRNSSEGCSDKTCKNKLTSCSHTVPGDTPQASREDCCPLIILQNQHPTSEYISFSWVGLCDILN